MVRLQTTSQVRRHIPCRVRCPQRIRPGRRRIGCGQPTRHGLLIALAIFAFVLTPPPARSDSAAINVSHEIDADFGYVAGTTTRGDGIRARSIDEWNGHLKYILSPQISNDLMLRSAPAGYVQIGCRVLF